MIGILLAALALQWLIVLALGLALWPVHLSLVGRGPAMPKVPTGTLKALVGRWRTYRRAEQLAHEWLAKRR